MPVDIGQRLNQKSQRSTGTEDALWRKECAAFVGESMAALVMHVQKVEEVDEVEIGIPQLTGALRPGFGGAARASIDCGDQRRPVIMAPAERLPSISYTTRTVV